MTEEISLEIIKKTQDSLGKYIKRPPLTEKLLKKPPFRFLHDIITNVINETGFLKGLYDSNEMRSENIKDRDSKIAFLQKLIEALSKRIHVTEKTTNEKITARPSKIIAGLEPAKTNQLLQIIGNALEKKLDSTQTVQQATAQIAVPEKKTNTKLKNDDKTRPKKSDEPKKLVRKNTEEKINLMKKKSSPRTEKENKKNAETLNENSTPRDDNKNKDNRITKKSVEVTSEKSVPAPEPATDAKPVIPDDSVSEKPDEINLQPDESESSKIQEAEKPKEDSPEPLKMQTEVLLARKPSARLRPPSVRPSSARPAAPRLRDKSDTVVPPEQLVSLGKVHVIVEQAVSDEDNEETVRLEMPVEDVVQHEITSVPNIPVERGHLVQQILTQIGEQTPVSTQPSEPRIDDHRLTQSIQTLTRAANPLGKLVSYVHEDVDSMLGELRAWSTVNRRLREELQREQQRNQDATRPLLQQLQRLDTDITRHRTMIHSAQANVLRNQHKIKQLLTSE